MASTLTSTLGESRAQESTKGRVSPPLVTYIAFVGNIYIALVIIGCMNFSLPPDEFPLLWNGLHLPSDKLCLPRDELAFALPNVGCRKNLVQY